MISATPENLVEVGPLDAGYASAEPVISGVEFTVPNGTLATILGPNGGGKTTLFRALLDELPYRSGPIALRDRVAYVPQTDRTRLDFPVDALSVALMGTYSDSPWYRPLGSELRRRAMDALERVNMAEHASERFGALSGGQRQRVLIARALARDARILLMDEPFAGLDRPSAERVNALMKSLRDEGRALLVSSHDIGFARDADLVLCLNRRQIGFGAPDRILTDEVLRLTYGGELITLPGGDQAIVIQHHHH